MGAPRQTPLRLCCEVESSLGLYFLCLIVNAGVPNDLRGRIWEHLSDKWRTAECDFTDAKFNELVVQPTIYLHAIQIDLRKRSTFSFSLLWSIPMPCAARTFPDNSFFQTDHGRLALSNVLKAYSNVDQDVGYCQGMGFLAGLLLLQVIILSFEFYLLTHPCFDSSRNNGPFSCC